MTTQTCSIEGCGGQGRMCRGWCWAHYMRWVTNGDPGPADIVRRQRGRTCSVPGCDRKHSGHGYCDRHRSRFNKYGGPGPAEIEPRQPDVICSAEGCEKTIRRGGRGWCNAHYIRWRMTGAPDTPFIERGIGDAAGYMVVHARVRKALGKASEHPCVHCGVQAQQWSYDHLDPDEKQDDRGPYSLDMSHYFPMCITCHRRFDVAYINLTKHP